MQSLVFVLVLLAATAVMVSAHLQPSNVKGITIVPSDKREADGYSVSAVLPSGHSGTRDQTPARYYFIRAFTRLIHNA